MAGQRSLGWFLTAGECEKQGTSALGHTFLRHFNYFQYAERTMTHVQRIVRIPLCCKYVLYLEALESVEMNFVRIRSQCTIALKGEGCRDTGLFKCG